MNKYEKFIHSNSFERDSFKIPRGVIRKIGSIIAQACLSNCEHPITTIQRIYTNINLYTDVMTNYDNELILAEWLNYLLLDNAEEIATEKYISENDPRLYSYVWSMTHAIDCGFLISQLPSEEYFGKLEKEHCWEWFACCGRYLTSFPTWDIGNNIVSVIDSKHTMKTMINEVLPML